MAMIKKGVSFNNSVVEVLDGRDMQCEQCSTPLNMMSSTNGVVNCSKCKHPNKVKDMESPNEQ